MAEMTAAQAIKVLHNNQYQKHIGNGEYDYIHPLTDAQAKGIAALLEQQAAEIDRLKENVRNMATMSDNHVKMIYEYKERRDKEIAKKDRMLEVACEQLQDYADEYTGGTAEQWLKWVEKEVGVQG